MKKLYNAILFEEVLNNNISLAKTMSKDDFTQEIVRMYNEKYPTKESERDDKIRLMKNIIKEELNENGAKKTICNNFGKQWWT